MELNLKDKKGRPIRDGDIILSEAQLQIDPALKKEFDGKIPYVVKIIDGDYFMFWKEHQWKRSIRKNDKESLIFFDRHRLKYFKRVAARGQKYVKRSGYKEVSTYKDFLNFNKAVQS